MEGLVVPLRRTIESTGAPGRTVPGFSLPKGIAPMLPIIIAGLTMGNNEQREQAAYAIGDLVERTEETAIKPFTTQLTGPLIRVITQATTYPPGVKTAILSALTTMLDHIPTHVKPFFPQLQRTFVKSAADAALSVRTRAAEALGVLMKSQPRVDPLITELIAGVRTNDDPIAASFALAISYVITSAGKNVGGPSRDALAELISDAFRDTHEENYNSAIARIFTALAPHPELLRPIITAHIVSGTPISPLSSQILLHAITETSSLFYTLKCVVSVVHKVVASIGSDQGIIARPAREAKDILRSQAPWADDSAVQSVFGL